MAPRPTELVPFPTAYGIIDIDEALGVDLGDRYIWAKNMVASRLTPPVKTKKVKRKAVEIPAVEDLERAITNITIDDTIKGSSTIVLELRDENCDLVDTGFFDANRDGKLDILDVNYPEGSEQWWRCTQVGMDFSGSGCTLTPTFMERAAFDLMSHKGPKKTSRGKVTRAEFIHSLTRSVKLRPIHLHSALLHKKQPVAGLTPTELKAQQKREQQDKKESKKDKNKGINRKAHLTVKGKAANPQQKDRAETLLQSADRLNANSKVMQALMCAAIGESAMGESKGSRGTTLQTTVISEQDLGMQGHYWCAGGHSFLAGGGIGYEKAHPSATPGDIASAVEVSDQGGSYYNAFADEAQDWVDAFGGGSGGAGGDEYTKQYNFEVGSVDKPHENFWDAANRLADEVKWPFFLDGQDAYYDPETELIKQKPVAVITRGDPEVVKLSGNWDVREIATECTLDLLCNPFEFRAGETMSLVNFGPASTGSTADPPLPGRWLIESWHRERFSLVTTFQLKQPTDPAPEPRSSTATRSTDEEEAGTGLTGPLRERILKIAKDSLSSKTHYNRYDQGGALTDNPTPEPPNRTDCSQWVRAVYLQAGAQDPGANTFEMERKCVRTSKPKPGDLVLMPDHVELFVGDGKTIGHGSPPIDYATVDAFRSRGCYYGTFDFLNEGGDTPAPRDARSYTKGGGRPD